MMLSLVKEHQNKTNLTTGVMSTEESTLATLFSTLWARASLRKERLKTPLGHSDKTFAIFILFWFYLNGPRTATGGFCLKLKYKKMRKRVIFFATNHNPPIICFVLQLNHNLPIICPATHVKAVHRNPVARRDNRLGLLGACLLIQCDQCEHKAKEHKFHLPPSRVEQPVPQKYPFDRNFSLFSLKGWMCVYLVLFFAYIQ